MQITRDNYSQYANMVQQMFGNKKNSSDPLAQCDYGNFALRFKPVDIKFTKPNWDNIMTKRDKPAMSEEEFEAAIKELAQKEFATGKRDDAASIIEEKLKKEQGRYETLLDMRMNNEIPREVFSRKQQEVEKKIAELEQQMMQYGDVKPATEADVSGKLENLQRLMGQFTMPEDGEFSEEEMDKYVSGVRVYEDRFEWLLNLNPDACGELDDAGSPVYFKKITVTPDDERAWFRKHPQWSKSNRYAELEVWIFI